MYRKMKSTNANTAVTKPVCKNEYGMIGESEFIIQSKRKGCVTAHTPLKPSEGV
jgi:hypothetical protein